MAGCGQKAESEVKSELLNNEFPESWPEDFKLFDEDGKMVDGYWVDILLAAEFMQNKFNGHTLRSLDYIAFKNNAFIYFEKGNNLVTKEIDEVRVEDPNTFRISTPADAENTFSVREFTVDLDSDIPMLHYLLHDYIFLGQDIPDVEEYLSSFVSVNNYSVLDGTETVMYSHKYLDTSLDYSNDISFSLGRDLLDKLEFGFTMSFIPLNMSITIDPENLETSKDVYIEPGTEPVLGIIEVEAKVDDYLQQNKYTSLVVVVENLDTGKKKCLGLTRANNYAGAFKASPGVYKIVGVDTIDYNEEKYYHPLQNYEDIFNPPKFKTSFSKDAFYINGNESTYITIDAITTNRGGNFEALLENDEEEVTYDALNNVFPESWPEDFKLFDENGELINTCWAEREKSLVYLETGKFGVENRIEGVTIKDGHFIYGYLSSDAFLYIKIDSVDTSHKEEIIITGTDYDGNEHTVTLTLAYRNDSPTIRYNGKTYLFGGYDFSPLAYMDEHYK